MRDQGALSAFMDSIVQVSATAAQEQQPQPTVSAAVTPPRSPGLPSAVSSSPPARPAPASLHHHQQPTEQQPHCGLVLVKSPPKAADGPTAELERRARAHVAADEHHQAVTLLEDHTQAALDRLLNVAETEVGSLQQQLTEQQAAVDTLQEQLQTAEGEATALRAEREREGLSLGSPVADAKAKALQEEVEALQVKVARVGSAMKIKEDAHANEIQT